MKVATYIEDKGGMEATAAHIARLEQAGLDMIWVNESYRFDAVSRIGFIAARTSRIEIGTGIVNAFSRTPALMAMTAAGCDYVSQGRFVLGLGASGPQVIEGFHGIPYEHPMQRIKEYIESCRMIWRREPYVYDGITVQAPLAGGKGTGLGKPLKLIDTPLRSTIPIWWASLKSRSVEATAQMADGWVTAMFIPERHKQVWGAALESGLATRIPGLGPLEISAGGILAIGEELVGTEESRVLDTRRDFMALYVGGMGARGKNFYNDMARGFGYDREATEVQNLYLAGKKKEAAEVVPPEWLRLSNLVGPPGHIAERAAAYREAGVTTLSVNPVGPDPAGQIRQLKDIVSSL
jgi:F420-dependent oxidoreductase-like protein